MHGFTKLLALEVARKGVTVNTVSPRYIATRMVMAVPQDVLETKIIPPSYPSDVLDNLKKSPPSSCTCVRARRPF
jgi:NAD(P)-dependent dehydrogenase (short-subunit alcohol dehydrogenase family)